MRMMRILISSWRRPHGEHRMLASGSLLRSACLPSATDFSLRIFNKHGDGVYGVEIEVSFCCQSGG